MTSNDPPGRGRCWFTFAMKCIFVDKPQTFRIWKLGRKSSGQISGKINQWERKQGLRTNRNGDFVIFPGTSWRAIGGLHISVKSPLGCLFHPHIRGEGGKNGSWVTRALYQGRIRVPPQTTHPRRQSTSCSFSLQTAKKPPCCSRALPQPGSGCWQLTHWLMRMDRPSRSLLGGKRVYLLSLNDFWWFPLSSSARHIYVSKHDTSSMLIRCKLEVRNVR